MKTFLLGLLLVVSLQASKTALATSPPTQIIVDSLRVTN